MSDFFEVAADVKKDCIEIYPRFNTYSEDVMIRGRAFYAVFDEVTNLWSYDESKALKMIDQGIREFINENYSGYTAGLKVSDCSFADSKGIKNWTNFVRGTYDRYHELDSTIKFANDPIFKTDYATHVLPYALAPGQTSAWDMLVGTLYSDSEKHKIEWSIGAIATGATKELQKFLVFYGEPGSGKSTVINLIKDMFYGYTAIFDAKALGSSSDTFALEAFKNNPLIAIQPDGDLSRIEDNTRINSISSHETIQINEKFKAKYEMRINSFLILGTNKPVKITDAKSGILRRLIDVEPTGNKLPFNVYNDLLNKIRFEYGAIVWKCRELFLQNPEFYNDYRPSLMMGTTNDFYNFVLDSYDVFSRDDSITLKQAWEMYKVYCEEARVPYPYSMRVVKEELKSYFREFNERKRFGDNILRNVYTSFRRDIFGIEDITSGMPEDTTNLQQYTIILKPQESFFDKIGYDYEAQYANSDGFPQNKWMNVHTTLKDIDTHKLHYVKLPKSHIVIDFDLKDSAGNKSLALNLKAASKWPPTYSEVSQGGNGLHLHYFYDGDPELLSPIFDDNIEVKVFTGNASLRRKLTRCNDLPVASISSGLPLKGDKKMISSEVIENERHLRVLIKKALNKEIHPNTAPNVDFIKMITDKAYEQSKKPDGFGYDVTDMRPSVMAFAASSTHQSERCLSVVNDIQWKSDEITKDIIEWPEDTYVFFDVEVFPNLFIICYKARGAENKVIKLIQPTRADVETLIKYKLIGFNNKRYDNQILYAWLMGYNNRQLFEISSRLVSGSPNATFSEAYNISYTDILDFASNKQSLKKYEIEMGVHHQEFPYPWDQDLPEDKWAECADYCANDVIATEALFDYLEADWLAREILAEPNLGNGTVNDSTNQLTQAIMFGRGNRKPQAVFRYRNMALPVTSLEPSLEEYYKEVTCLPLNFVSPQDVDDIEPYMRGERAFPFTASKLPYWPGYRFDMGKSWYRGEDPKEGGYVYAEPGMWFNVALLDIASMHPTSIELECSFGEQFTRKFHELKMARVYIKHKEFDKAKKLFNGALAKYLDDPKKAKTLAYALKIAINAVYGQTAAKFENPFRDSRNKDNCIAKRGALFMIDLKHEIQKRGFTVAHIKTDSIKIPNATPEIIQFVMDFGKYYGYTFEHEATYEKMTLVNDAVYIAKYATAEWCQNAYGCIPENNMEHPGEWTATGTQFAVPYVFKTLFSHEPIVFDDMCETKETRAGTIFIDYNEDLKDTEAYEKQLKKLEKKEGSEEEIAKLLKKIDENHKYQFVGRIGRFTPVLPGCGGGALYRKQDDKYFALSGTKDRRWLESEELRKLGNMDIIDKSYYEELANDAIAAISQYGDFNQFVA